MRKPHFYFWMFLGGTFLLIAYLNYRFPDVLTSSTNIVGLIQVFLVLAYSVYWVVFHPSERGRLWKNALIWVGIVGVVFIGYSYRFEAQDFYDRLRGELFPFQAIQRDNKRVEFALSPDGHFNIEGQVEGVSIRFLVDTGATRVVLTPQDAQRLGIALSTLSFDQLTQTANGQVFTASIRLPFLKVGPILVYNVLAAISRGGLEQSLLGMSFLNRLKSWSVSREKLILEN